MSNKLLILLSVLCYSCNVVAVWFSDEKERSAFEDTALETEVHQYFWNQLHQGHYDSLDKVLDKLHYAYMQDPQDFKIAAHLGFAYVWQITERQRLDSMPPSIAAAGDLSQRYFEEAVALNPYDPRLQGFKAGLMLANGSRHADDKLRTKGYFEGQEAIREWPSFNLFSVGYVMSVIEHDKERYAEALEYQWQNLEACLCREIDRDKPDLSDIDEIPGRVADDYKKSRSCTNSWIAPHNVEGFLLNLGDMLVKKGETEQAREVYESIRLVDEFEAWPYRTQLAYRLENMNENVENFRRQERISDNQQVFIRTEFGCMGCHQKSEAEFARQNGSMPLDRETYFLD